MTDSSQMVGQIASGLGSAKRPRGELQMAATKPPRGGGKSLRSGDDHAVRDYEAQQQQYGKGDEGVGHRGVLTLCRSFAIVWGTPDWTSPVRTLLLRGGRDVLLERLLCNGRDVRGNDPRSVLRLVRARMVLPKVCAENLCIDTNLGGEFLRGVCFRVRHSFDPFVCVCS